METLKEAAEGHNIDLSQLLFDLNNFYATRSDDNNKMNFTKELIRDFYLRILM